ncbi:UNVERIFIED_CONTAM: Vesicle-associated membrane protein 3 [Gekko kuhli]
MDVDKVLKRDQKLLELDDRADTLQAGASRFETSAAKLKYKYWWKNIKKMVMLGIICTVILIIIIINGHLAFTMPHSPFRSLDALPTPVGKRKEDQAS